MMTQGPQLDAFQSAGAATRHVRKTIAFDGSANNGNLGDQVTVFTATGRVIVERVTAYVSETLVSVDLAQVILGFGAVDSPDQFGYVNITDSDAGRWFNGTGFVLGSVQPLVYSPTAWSGNAVLHVADAGTGADITDGTIIIDCWYLPITDDGRLVAS